MFLIKPISCYLTFDMNEIKINNNENIYLTFININRNIIDLKTEKVFCIFQHPLFSVKTL